VVTAGVGISRVALGQHHVGDVVGGYILGGLGLWCATRIVKIAPAEGGKPDGE
jgi:membrane-associated phospholipid phosphatase